MDKIKTERLDRILSEIDLLIKQKEYELDRAEIEVILEELNLPVELLDEALIKIQTKKYLEIQKRRFFVSVVGTLVVILCVVGFFFYSHHQRQIALSKMLAIKSRITLEEDNGGDLKIIDLKNSPQLHFRVTLKNTPVGKPLSLGCDWTNSKGQVVHQNRYNTRAVEKEIWNTRCRYRLGSTSQTGEWEVKMFSGDRLLASDSFLVQ